MVAGQSGKKTGAIIQARMQSTRLPGKVIMPLPFINGKPLLQHIIEALKESNYIDEIILATSLNSENDILENIASQNNIHFFRGSEADVLSRFVSITELYNLDTVVRVTADNPILDISLLDKLLIHHHAENNHYTRSSHLPLGMNMEIMSTSVLKEIHLSPNITNEDREHVTLYIGRTVKYTSEIKPLWSVSLTEKIRLTIDYPIDYVFISLLFTIATEKNKKGMELINWVNNYYPWMWEVNKLVYQKKQYPSLKEELNAAIKVLAEADFYNVVKLLKGKK